MARGALAGVEERAARDYVVVESEVASSGHSPNYNLAPTLYQQSVWVPRLQPPHVQRMDLNERINR
jgi:hypothetical protein